MHISLYIIFKQKLTASYTFCHEHLCRSLGQASPCLSAFAAGQAAAYKMFQTINRKPQIDAYDSNGRIPDDINGDIELKDVCFTYPTRPDEMIFSSFSLSIPSGTTAALVGQSGSGKSTVISLIERFYDPQEGAILIDGINLKDFQLRWIRGKIGLVSQEPVLFTSSIKDNVIYGKDGATEAEIRAALELANAAKFVDKLPQVISHSPSLMMYLLCSELSHFNCSGSFTWFRELTQWWGNTGHNYPVVRSKEWP